MSRSFIVAASLAIVQAKDHCNAVALSGGGSNGAWEVGVIWGLTHYGNPQDFEWDWVTGVSAGSINTAGLAGWAPGEEKMASEWLSYTMTTMKTSDVWQLWPNTTLVDALTKKPSLVNSAPALQFLTDTLAQPQFADGYKRNVTIGTVNVETGQYTTFGNNNCAFGEELANAALCSSSIPIVFPPNHFQGQYYMDGGTTWNINVSSAVNGCKSLGFDEAHITVDVFICGGSTDIDPEDEIGHTLNNFRRARKINDYYNNVDAIQTQLAAFPGVNWRYLIVQEDPYGGMKEINFNNENTWPLQLKGRQQAQEALAYGPGFGFDSYIH